MGLDLIGTDGQPGCVPGDRHIRAAVAGHGRDRLRPDLCRGRQIAQYHRVGQRIGRLIGHRHHHGHVGINQAGRRRQRCHPDFRIRRIGEPHVGERAAIGRRRDVWEIRRISRRALRENAPVGRVRSRRRMFLVCVFAPQIIGAIGDDRAVRIHAMPVDAPRLAAVNGRAGETVNGIARIAAALRVVLDHVALVRCRSYERLDELAGTALHPDRVAMFVGAIAAGERRDHRDVETDAAIGADRAGERRDANKCGAREREFSKAWKQGTRFFPRLGKSHCQPPVRRMCVHTSAQVSLFIATSLDHPEMISRASTTTRGSAAATTGESSIP